MRKIAVAAAVSTLLVACTTTDPYTGETKTSKAATGAIIGGVAGAAVGAATAGGNKRESIATGAIAGAALGGGVGYYMDRQEAKLRQELQGTGVQVVREGDTVNLVMPGNITFATGRYEIRSDFYAVLNSVTKVLNEFNKTSIVVSGHTDSTGAADFNQVLSEQRAQSVKDYLLGKGIARGRVNAVGYGKRYPVATNSTAAGRQANRRVELKLEPIQ